VATTGKIATGVLSGGSARGSLSPRSDRHAVRETPPLSAKVRIENESVPIQLAQCCFPGLAISNLKIFIYFSDKIYGSNFIKQHWETVMIRN